MKSIIECINSVNESRDDWRLETGNYPSFNARYAKDADYICICPEGSVAILWNSREFDDWADEYDMNPEEIDELKHLKPGEAYDADGGLHVYFRIK